MSNPLQILRIFQNWLNQIPTLLYAATLSLTMTTLMHRYMMPRTTMMIQTPSMQNGRSEASQNPSWALMSTTSSY